MIAKQPLPLVADAFPHLHEDPATVPSTVDPFTITSATGFLPLRKPLTQLPDVFKPLVDLLDAMPVVRADGSPGLLGNFKLVHTIDDVAALPDLTEEVVKIVEGRDNDGRPNLEVVTALFRDFSFLASAYLMEPCWERWSQNHDDGYGLGRDVLPACIAGPMVKCADVLEIPPFLAYAASYALYNYSIANHAGNSPIASDYSSLSLIRAFEKGLDPKSSEAGFILTHLDMVRQTPGLIDGTVSILDHLTAHHMKTIDTPDADTLVSSLHKLLSSMNLIETSMSRMWSNSLPHEYLPFRTFIFGITSQSMFPNGVRYQIPPSLASTLSPSTPPATWTKPLNFRGEAGANDAIIPLLDSLLSIPMPSNPLTSILHEFRAYRPRPHRDFLAFVRERADTLNVRDVLATTSFETRALLLSLLDRIRSFRWRHWTFAREYIIRRTSYPTATGGAPVVRWLPNQLEAVMDLMVGIWESEDVPRKWRDREDANAELKEMMEAVYVQREKLQREVQKWCQERGQ